VPRHFLPDGSECDETGLPIVPMTLPDDGSPPLTSSPPGSLVDIGLEPGRSSKSDLLLAEALHWTIE
jgi:hypothetical protein